MQRRQILSLFGLLVLPFRLLATNRQPTLSQTEGPFYPVIPIPLRASLIRDNKKLVGKVIQLEGHVLDQQGRPLQAAKIEIWQCDGNGLYEHPAQDGRQHVDPSFVGFGAQLSNQQGYYSFTTLYPAPYPGRPPHIHVKIWQNDRELLTTQLYLQGKTGGGWFKTQRERLQINPKQDSDGLLKAEFSFIV